MSVVKLGWWRWAWSAALSLAACTDGRDSFTGTQRDHARASAAEVDEAMLTGHVEQLLQTRETEKPVFVDFYPDHPHTHTKSAAYVEQTLRQFGLDPKVERSNADDISVLNVSVDIRGVVSPHEIVVLSAHHDAWFSGADDNASGVAVLLEAARILKDVQSDRTIRIIAFDMEEYGSIGANRYLLAHEANEIVSVVNLDCVAYASHAHGSQMAPVGLQVRDVGDFIAIIGNAAAEAQLSSVVTLSRDLEHSARVEGLLVPNDGLYPALRDFLRSDHAPFWRIGSPALFFTDTASFRNHNYHTATDTLDTLDRDFFVRSAALIIGAVRALATES